MANNYFPCHQLCLFPRLDYYVNEDSFTAKSGHHEFEYTGFSMNKREAILQATLHLLAHKGFHGFSIKQVADQAGVAAGTVYLYFNDREDLILQLDAQIMEQVAQYIFANHNPRQPLFDQFQQLCLSFWHFFKQNPEILLSKNQFDHLPPDVLRNRHADAKTIFYPLITFFESGRDSGALKSLPNEVLFSLAFEHFFALARNAMIGLVNVDEEMLKSIILASWDAITTVKS